MTRRFDVDRHTSLYKAIMRRVGLRAEEAQELAVRMLNYFGYGEEVIDNSLDQQDRRLFYFLQDVGLLKTAWEEAILSSGRIWRIFYWYLNVENIEEFSKDEVEFHQEEALYETLPEYVWNREELKEESA